MQPRVIGTPPVVEPAAARTVKLRPEQVLQVAALVRANTPEPVETPCAKCAARADTDAAIQKSRDDLAAAVVADAEAVSKLGDRISVIERKFVKSAQPPGQEDHTRKSTGPLDGIIFRGGRA